MTTPISAASPLISRLGLQALRSAWWVRARSEHLGIGLHSLRLHAAALHRFEASEHAAPERSNPDGPPPGPLLLSLGRRCALHAPL